MSIRKIIINSGHFSGDSGAVVEGVIEREENKKIRDALIPLLKDFEVIQVPDNLNLRRSIDYTNLYVKGLEDGLAVDIHLNRDSGIKSGTEIYYFAGSQKSKDKAEVLSRNIAQTLGIPNNGAKPDTSSAVGELGWIRQVNCWSFVIEVLYMDNPLGRFGAISKFIKNQEYGMIAQGIANGIKELCGDQQEQLTRLQNLINQLKEQIRKLLLKINN